MKTTHQIFIQSAQNLKEIEDESIHLVVTSPPYPMIEMWDEPFSNQNPEIKIALEDENGKLAYDLMHDELTKVWKECYRALHPGGIACINIGDATRTINGIFNLFPNHSRIIESCLNIGFQSLPEILWRKPTNAPNKFMGSGMLPPGAYVTLEHEHILIFRKGDKRKFPSEELKVNRRESAYFWEERNVWFSDQWDIKGVSQQLRKNSSKEESNPLRSRSAAYPFELAYRLINMFTVKEDVVLDPFLGTGTTMFAAMTSQRNSIGIEIEEGFLTQIQENVEDIIESGNEYNKKRLSDHINYMNLRLEEDKPIKYNNEILNVPVITKQEKKLRLPILEKFKQIDKKTYEIIYKIQ